MEPVAPFLVEDKARAERWKHLTEGINDPYTKAVVEQLMDNTKRWIDETSRTDNIAVFTRFAFPLIRRIFPNLIAQQLVSIQPMTQPTGKVFYLDFKYQSDYAPTKAGDRMDSYFNRLYASGKIRGEVLGQGDGDNKAFKLAHAPVQANTVVVYVDSQPVALAGVDLEKGEVELAQAPAAGASVTADYDLVLEGTTNVPEIGLDMAEDTISAERKSLKAKWTIEAQQDLYAYHGLDAEAELTQLMADELSREINYMILDDILAGATAGNVNWESTPPADWNDTREAWERTIFSALIDADNLVYKKRLRRTNWIVTSPDVSARLEKLNAFRLMNPGTEPGGVISTGPNVFGTLANRWTVIVDPLFESNKMLLGYKGASMMETGYVYAPYIPFYVTPTIVDPNDFTPRRGMMTRFARKLVNGDFYATVTIL